MKTDGLYLVGEYALEYENGVPARMYWAPTWANRVRRAAEHPLPCCAQTRRGECARPALHSGPHRVRRLELVVSRCPHVDHKGRRCTLAASVHTVHSYTRGLRQLGAKALRELPAIDACREEVRARNGGACECWYPEACGRTDEHRGQEMHHRAPSDRDKGVHDPARCVWICRPAHTWIGNNVAEAVELGLLLRSGGERTEAI